MADAGKVMIFPKGEYSASMQYEIYDMVTYKNVSYIALKDNQGIIPSEDTSDTWSKWIDGNIKILLDNEMSDESENAVKNKVVKAYTDDAYVKLLGFENKTTTEEDGTIIETFADGRKIVTTESEDGKTITQKYYDKDGALKLTKTTVESDGVITENVERSDG